MAIYWGPFTSGYSNNFRVGIDLSVSGTTITARYYYQCEYSVNDGATLNRSGSLTGAHSFQASSSGGSPVLITTNTRAGVRGQVYSFGASITGLYNGASPSVSGANIAVPALPPNTAGKPSVSSITSSSFVAKTVAPANNGAAITHYEWQWTGAISGSTTSPGIQLGPTQGFPANSALQVRARAVNAAGPGGWSAWSNVFYTKPLAPAAPGTPTVTRVNDSQHTITWARNATSAAPYSSQTLQRNTYIKGEGWTGWTSIASKSGTATSHSDTTTRAGNTYMYRLYASNPAGNSQYSGQSATIVTTPLAPTSPKATKQTSGSILVSWVNQINLGSGWVTEIQESTNGGGTWTALDTRSNDVSQYTHASPSTAAPHTYRVRSVSQGLASAWATTNTVQLAAPPNTPVVQGPSGALDATLPITLRWLHVPVDSSDQRKYQLRYRVQGVATWTELSETTSSTEQRVMPGGTWDNGLTIEWQVRTWGIHVNASPWSATAVFLTSTPPVATIVTPEDASTWTTPELSASWDFFDTDGDPQAGWQLQLLDADGEVQETRNGSGTETTDAFTTLVPDSSEWTVQLRLRDGDGLWSEWVTSTFTVDYPEPVAPVISANWQPEQGAVELGVDNPEPTEGEPEVVYNDVYRSTDGGANWVLVATQLPPNSTSYDYEAPVVGAVWYRAVAYSELPSMTESEPFELLISLTMESSGYLSAGPGYSVVGRALYDLSVDDGGGRIRTQQRFAGREDPVQFDGHSRSRVLNISFKTLPEWDEPAASLVDAWYALRELRGPHLWRDPSGRVVYGTISDIGVSEATEGVHEVSFTLTRTGRR